MHASRLDPKETTNAKKAGTLLVWGTLSGNPWGPQKILKIRCPRSAKNAFAIYNICYIIL
jgi:hypothetical protein